VPVELLAVRVEAAELGVVDRRRQPCADQPGDQLQAPGQAVVIGVLARVVIVNEHLLEPGRCWRTRPRCYARRTGAKGSPRPRPRPRSGWRLRSRPRAGRAAPADSDTPNRRRNCSTVASEGTCCCPTPRRACGSASAAMCKAGASAARGRRAGVDGTRQPAGFPPGRGRAVPYARWPSIRSAIGSGWDNRPTARSPAGRRHAAWRNRRAQGAARRARRSA